MTHASGVWERATQAVGTMPEASEVQVQSEVLQQGRRALDELMGTLQFVS